MSAGSTRKVGESGYPRRQDVDFMGDVKASERSAAHFVLLGGSFEPILVSGKWGDETRMRISGF